MFLDENVFAIWMNVHLTVFPGCCCCLLLLLVVVVVVGACWCVLGACWMPAGCLLGACWVPAGCLLGACWVPAGCLLGACWVPAGCLLVVVVCVWWVFVCVCGGCCVCVWWVLCVCGGCCVCVVGVVQDFRASPRDRPSPGRPKFRSFFALSHRKFHSLFSLWEFSRGILVGLKTGTLKCARLEFSGCRVKPRKPFWLKVLVAIALFHDSCKTVQMPRKGWSAVQVPDGWLQVIRGPRPPSNKWPTRNRQSSEASRRGPLPEEVVSIAQDQVLKLERQWQLWASPTLLSRICTMR